jgi:D-tagatose-1,6-bisphosphate aldolase subunit GatZ/KbaZ
LIPKTSNIKEVIWKTVVDSQRWKKWVNETESAVDFYANSPQRQEWMVKTCARYIWENPGVLATRDKLFKNVENHGINAEEVLITHIEKAMERYFYKFNLVDLNNLL